MMQIVDFEREGSPSGSCVGECDPGALEEAF